MLRIIANHPQVAFTPDNFALNAYFLYRSSNFHNYIYPIRTVSRTQLVVVLG